MNPTPAKTRKAAPSAVQPFRHPARPVAGAVVREPLRLLVPTDFSRPAARALQYAGAFARRYGGRLTLLTVIEPDPLSRFETNLLAVSRKTLHARVAAELSDLARQHVAPEHLEAVWVRSGKPFVEIVHAAQALKADLIILATHGYTGLRRVLLGSTAERVLREAPCPVLVVPAGQKQGWPVFEAERAKA
jgi:nucleotide-binding universal stress UspA family protein